MKMQAHKSSYLPMLITSIAVVLLGSAGVARIMGWLPNPIGGFGNIFAIKVLSTASAKPAAESVDMDLPQTPGSARSSRRCPECGVIVSMREIGPNAGLGAVRQELAGNEHGMRGTPARSYEFTVRLEGGSRRVIIDANPESWQPGERVIIIDGTNPPHQ